MDSMQKIRAMEYEGKVGLLFYQSFCAMHKPMMSDIGLGAIMYKLPNKLDCSISDFNIGQ